MGDRLYIGIDLGTFQSTIATSKGDIHTIETVVGTPKDPVARNMLGRDTLFGEDALKNRLACDIYRPLAAGVAQDDAEHLNAAKDFVTHLIDSAGCDEYDEVYGVICSPSHISFTDKTNLVSILRGKLTAIMVVSEPFAVAFAIQELMGSIIVDSGAGTTDIARIVGRFPEDDDQITIPEAGDWVDLSLMSAIEKKYTGAQITKDMVRKWKEKSSYVGGDAKEVLVDLSVEGKSQTVDIGDLIETACDGLAQQLGTAVKSIISGGDPEYQPLFRKNIYLAGGSSKIKGLAKKVTEYISDIGEVSVSAVKKPEHKVAEGALALAESMPDEEYTSIV
ncbi:MAG: rod shape-determining protein [Candidatus Thermoplasmatota archaeon]|nr:rod shape-determining protein [Candidatus Thermoplasmatota archaeon]